MKPLALLAAVVLLTGCQCLRDHYDLWFVVPKNPFTTPPLPNSTSP